MKLPAIAFTLLAAVGLPAPLVAQTDITVVASIKPVHSLVASVMEGVGEPALIVSGAGSPHTYALRPSEAAALQEADVIYWIGEALETFLERPIENLPKRAMVVELMDVEGVVHLPIREGGAFDAHAHEDDAHAEQAHEDDAHAEHAHEDDEHAHGEDAHAFLDPHNAKAMVKAIAARLSEAAPDRRHIFAKNAEATLLRLDALEADLNTRLAPVKGRPFVVFHDAYQYFEHRFGLTAAGSITVNPDVRPGANRISEIKQRLGETGAVCVFSEPQFQPAVVDVVTEGTSAGKGVLDPLGAGLEAGPDLYFTLLTEMANALRDCLTANS